jgi:hypothetical protein
MTQPKIQNPQLEVQVPAYSNVVRVAKLSTDPTVFNTIKEAVESIPTSIHPTFGTVAKQRTAVYVAPGYYPELPFTIPTFVSIVSEGIDEYLTHIQAITTTAPLITMHGFSALVGFVVLGANGVGGKGVYITPSYGGPNSVFALRRIKFLNNTVDLHFEGGISNYEGYLLGDAIYFATVDSAQKRHIVIDRVPNSYGEMKSILSNVTGVDLPQYLATESEAIFVSGINNTVDINGLTLEVVGQVPRPITNVIQATSGYQEVDVGGAVTGATATGLTNDGTVYTATVTIDSNNLIANVSVVGSAAQTYTDLLNEINTDLGTDATATLVGGNIHIESATVGTDSYIQIVDISLFLSLTTYSTLSAEIAGTFGEFHVSGDHLHEFITETAMLVINNTGYPTIAQYIILDKEYNPQTNATIIIPSTPINPLTDISGQLLNEGERATGDGVVVQDGAKIKCISSSITGYQHNIRTLNVGEAPNVYFAVNLSGGSTIRDLSIEHPGTTGSFTGTARQDKVYIHPDSSASVSYVDTSTQSGSVVAGKLFLGPNNSTVTDFTALLSESLSTGLLSGGSIGLGVNPLEISVTAGYGYIGLTTANIPSLAYTKQLSWDTTELVLPDNANSYIYIIDGGVSGYQVVDVGGAIAGASATGLTDDVPATAGYQVVDVGGAIAGASATGLANDATVYTATITVDGVAMPIAITGNTAQDYTTLLAELNTDLGASATASIVGGNIRVTSSTTGITSTVAIVDVDLFATLTDFVTIVAAVAGTAIVTTTYTASLHSDRTAQVTPISIIGSEAQTYNDLLSKISTQIAPHAMIELHAGNVEITSTSSNSPTSSVSIVDIGSNPLFASLVDFVAINAPRGGAIGSLSSSPAEPDKISTIKLGRVQTIGGVVAFISDSPNQITHATANLAIFNQEAVGPLYSAGSSVTKNITNLPTAHIDVSSGSYFYSNLKFTPVGGTKRQFYPWYNINGTWQRGAITDVLAKDNYNRTSPGYQDVDVGGAKILADATGLTNDATVYTATIDVDGISIPISVVGSSAQTYTTLLNEINADLGAAATASLSLGASGNIRITSEGSVLLSTISVSTPVDLFSSLTSYAGVLTAVDGGIIPIPAGKYVAHTLYIGGDGANEQYQLVYGQSLYDDQASAIQGAIPTPPPSFLDIVTHIAMIVVTRENAVPGDRPWEHADNTIVDVRPRIGAQAPSTSNVSSHGNLLNLNVVSDHPGYLTLDGTRTMIGDLQMGGLSITGVNLVDGVNVSAHASRHLPTGLDPLTTAAPTTDVSAVSTNGVGSANSLSRSDHTHAVSGLGVLANPLSQFAATTSAQLLGVLTDETGSGSAVFGTAPTLSSPKVLTELVMDKASGVGIKVDTTIPTYPYRDITGVMLSSGGAAPSLTAFRGGSVRSYNFATNNTVDIAFHLPHDYAPNTDLFVHYHWAHNGTAISGNIVTTIAYTYAKGHNQAIFDVEKTQTMTYNTVNIATTPRWSHRLVEVQLSTPGGSASLLDTSLMEPDGIIGLNFVMTTPPSITGGSPNTPFVFFIDLHYQSTGVGTKNKAPNFYA